MKNEQPESLLIVGSGAMACLFAARLIAAGIPVIMLANWQEGLDSLQLHGITLVEGDGSQKIFPVKATDNPQECKGISLALVLVKSWQTTRSAEQLAVCLSSQGLALTLQNGLNNIEILNRFLGQERVALGVMTIGAYLLAPGVVKQAGDGEITLGEHPRLGRVTELLTKAGFSLASTQNLNGLIWGKLVINAAINPLSALFEIPNGEIVNNPYTRRIMREIVTEVVAVAQAQGISLTFPDATEAVEAVVYRTAENRSSMLQDIQRGAPTEIDAICGAIVQAGEKTGVETPINRLLWQLIKAKVEI